MTNRIVALGAGLVLAVALAAGFHWLSGENAGGGSPDGELAAAGDPGELEMTVYLSPTCECCSGWVEHMEDHGFETDLQFSDDLEAVKEEAGVPRDLVACHTAVIGGYVVEGHVPADDVKRFLEEEPEVAGLAVPGMPMGSPGMEGPRQDEYDVLAFQRDGETEVFTSHP